MSYSQIACKQIREQLCPRTAGTRAQLQLGLLPSAEAPLCAFPSFPLTADQISPHGGVHSLRTSASLHGTSVQIRQGSPLGRGRSQLQSLVSRRHLCGKNKALHFLKGCPMPGPKVWSATACENSEFSPNSILCLVPL